MVLSPEIQNHFHPGLTTGHISVTISCKLHHEYFLFDSVSRRPSKSHVRSPRGDRGTLEEEWEDSVSASLVPWPKALDTCLWAPVNTGPLLGGCDDRGCYWVPEDHATQKMCFLTCLFWSPWRWCSAVYKWYDVCVLCRLHCFFTLVTDLTSVLMSTTHKCRVYKVRSHTCFPKTTGNEACC